MLLKKSGRNVYDRGDSVSYAASPSTTLPNNVVICTTVCPPRNRPEDPHPPLFFRAPKQCRVVRLMFLEICFERPPNVYQ